VGSRSRARARAQASQATPERSLGARRAVPPDAAPDGMPSAEPVPNSAAQSGPSAGQLPRSVLVAAIAQAVEAAGLVVASLLAAIATAQGQSYQDASGIAITLIGFGAAVALALVARALHAGRRWTRTPAMLTQLFTGIVAIYLIQSGRLDWGIPAIVVAIVGLGALLTPGSIEVLTPGRISKS
jgi:hypothetical protein